MRTEFVIPSPYDISEQCLHRLATVFRSAAEKLWAIDLDPSLPYRSPSRFLIRPLFAIAGVLNGTSDLQYGLFDAKQRQRIDDYIDRQVVLYKTYGTRCNFEKLAQKAGEGDISVQEVIRRMLRQKMKTAYFASSHGNPVSAEQLVRYLTNEDLVKSNRCNKQHLVT